MNAMFLWCDEFWWGAKVTTKISINLGNNVIIMYNLNGFESSTINATNFKCTTINNNYEIKVKFEKKKNKFKNLN